MSESKGTPFSQKNNPDTCVKVRKQGEYRYSSSPLGKRIDIYETSETEEDCNSMVAGGLKFSDADDISLAIVDDNNTAD